MTDARDEISRIIEKAEQAAYARGWRDAVTAMKEAAEQFRDFEPDPHDPNMVPSVTLARTQPRRTGRPSSKAIRIVEDCIAATPGMRGVEVVKAAQSIDSSVKERTVRTCLRRLRLNKTIWKRNGLWYPKAKEKSLFDNVTAEAA